MINDGIIRDVRILYEQEKEEDYYKLKIVNSFLTTIISNMKVMVVKIETYHLIFILTKLKLTWET